jgi:regulation of enolase protein 1 (concanavalin A-like superfamily)
MSISWLDTCFDQSQLDPRLAWFNPPARWRIDPALPALVIEPDAKTDFWQVTHYGFSAASGHFLYAALAGDFVLSASIRFKPAHQYDQAGLMVRLSDRCWLKTSVEYEPGGPGRLGAVVTNAGLSDWSTQDYNGEAISLRVRREQSDYIVAYHDGQAWSQLRMAGLHEDDGGIAQCGLYACSPTAAGFSAFFERLTIATGRLQEG